MEKSPSLFFKRTPTLKKSQPLNKSQYSRDELAISESNHFFLFFSLHHSCLFTLLISSFFFPFCTCLHCFYFCLVSWNWNTKIEKSHHHLNGQSVDASYFSKMDHHHRRKPISGSKQIYNCHVFIQFSNTLSKKWTKEIICFNLKRKLNNKIDSSIPNLIFLLKWRN